MEYLTILDNSMTLLATIASLLGVGGGLLIGIKRAVSGIKVIRQAVRAFDEVVKEDTVKIYLELKNSGEYPDLVRAIEKSTDKVQDFLKGK